MSEHVRVERNGGVLAITLARPERRNAITVAMYAALADAIEQAAGDPRVRVITLRGEGQDFAAGNDLADFLDAAAARRRGDPGLAAASRARDLRNSDRRRGPRQLRRHRHDHAASLRPGDRRGRRALFAAVRRPGAGAGSGELAAPAAACRPPPRRALLLLGEPFGVDEAWTSASSATAPAGATRRDADAIVAALLAKPPEALRQTQRLLRHGAREEMLERMKLEGELFAERLAVGRSEGGDRRLLREAERRTDVGQRAVAEIQTRFLRVTFIVGPGRSAG